MHVMVTGSSGLIGSEAVLFFDRLGAEIVGVDNNMRADFFGPNGDTTPNLIRLQQACRRFTHHPIDIRDRQALLGLMSEARFDLIIHAAGQPSHDLAARRPFDDFEVNAVGTLNLLEAYRRHSPEGVFITVSTNKVYGDGPNHLPLVEQETRWEFAEPRHQVGIAEDFPVDRTLHSLFGVSKLSADLMTQEYGRYFGLRTGVFRGGCLTGPSHAGVELHGFLNYITQATLDEAPYTIYGYKGKQVRDQIHSHDVITAFWEFAQSPRPGEVYNLGGGRPNASSLLETVEMIAERTGKRPQLTYSEVHRIGDHICYYTDLAKLRKHYPKWELTYSLEDILDEMVDAIQRRRRP